MKLSLIKAFFLLHGLISFGLLPALGRQEIFPFFAWNLFAGAPHVVQVQLYRLKEVNGQILSDCYFPDCHFFHPDPAFPAALESYGRRIYHAAQNDLISERLREGASRHFKSFRLEMVQKTIDLDSYDPGKNPWAQPGPEIVVKDIR